MLISLCLYKKDGTRFYHCWRGDEIQELFFLVSPVPSALVRYSRDARATRANAVERRQVIVSGDSTVVMVEGQLRYQA